MTAKTVSIDFINKKFLNKYNKIGTAILNNIEKDIKRLEQMTLPAPFSLVSGSAIGIAGGELEYRDHVNGIYNQHIKGTGIDKPGTASKILPFQGEKSCKTSS
jgi:hypothetical protein